MIDLTKPIHALRLIPFLSVVLGFCALALAAASQPAAGSSAWLPYVGEGSAAHAVAVQPDGMVVAVGTVVIAGKHRFLVARFSSDGALDASFGSRITRSESEELLPGGGVVTVRLGSWASASAVAIRPDGRIVVAGTFYSTGARRIAFVGLQPDGSIDRTFGKNGITVVASRFDLSLAGLVVEPGGTILFAGTEEANLRPLVGRLDSSGWHDESFGGYGLADLDDVDGSAAAIGLQSDGTVVVGFTVDGSIRAGHREIWVLALDRDGQRIRDFGEDGIARLAGLQGHDDLTDLRIQQDDRIVLVGSRERPGVRSVFVARLLSDGRLDRGYRGGVSSIDAFGPADPQARPRIAVTPAGNVVIATSIRTGNRLLVAAVRLSGGDGESDSGFGRGGILIVDVGVSALLTGVGSGPNGDVAVVGHDEQANQMFVMRIDHSDYELHGARLHYSEVPTTGMPIDIGPHPVRGPATVQFAIPEDAHVRVALYDRLGRRVVVLADRRMAAGRQVLQVDLARFPVGVYILRVQMDTQTVARRITVL